MSPLLMVRPASADDVPGLLRLAIQSGGGLTNLPPDGDALARRVALSEACLAAPACAPEGSLILLVMELLPERTLVGTASLFTRLGQEWPFYSYRITKLAQTSKELNKTLSSDLLHLVNDFDGCSEVGGLFVDPAARALGAGRLMARSRYLFIAGHRDRFADRIIADMRGYADASGRRPFWEGLGRHFFDMEFEEADRFNALSGNQFIADLMPKYPIYVRLLPEDAQAALGRPHVESEPALRLLETEGFRRQGYVDIFDGGPTVACDVEALRLVREQRCARLVAGAPCADAPTQLIGAGTGARFRASMAPVEALSGTDARADAAVIAALEIDAAQEVRLAPL